MKRLEHDAEPRRPAGRAQIASIERRLFLGRGLSLGALAMLSGCNITDGEGVQKVLWAMSRWNDRVQAWMFDPNKLAPEYPESEDHAAVPVQRLLRGARGPARRRRRATSSRSAGWSATSGPGRCPSSTRCRRPPRSPATSASKAGARSASGAGVRFATFLERIGADTTAKYVGFKCADDYSSSIDMPTALHPQTQLTLRFAIRAPAAEVRLPDEAAHADQARLQEPEAHRGALRHQHLSGRLLGRPGLQLVQRLVIRALVPTSARA